MLRVGITGGIGTGKTIVCNIFKLLGIPVYDADSRAKQLVEELPELQFKISSLFGPEAFSPEGMYNRKWISARIFVQPYLKKALEDIIHPAVFEDNLKWFDQQKKNNFPYAIKEAALLFESGSYRDLDKLIVVDAPMEVRIKRIINRDGLKEEEIKKRIHNQWPQDIKINQADYIIRNDNQTALLPQVWRIHHSLLQLTSLSL